jgi:hypothetical protein
MVYSGPIDLDRLIDLDPLHAAGECPYTFLAFPASGVNDYGVPTNTDAQRYVAAIQAAGVPVGIWLATPVDGASYAAVAHDSIPLLHRTIETLTETGQFPASFAADLSEQLFRDAVSRGG